MGRRGGARPRHPPASVPVSVSGGRWGRRRARVEECAAVLAAELVYGHLVCQGGIFAPGSRGRLTWTPADGSAASWDVEAEVLPNAVWRRGRLFLRCRHCGQRATRLYVPVAGCEPRCRRCWGLSYVSRSWSYKPVGFFGRYFGTLAYGTTRERRKQRRQAARERYEDRRPFLGADVGPVAEEPGAAPQAPAQKPR